MADSASLGSLSIPFPSKWEFITSLDFFPKLKEDIKIKTGAGGLITLFCFVLVFCLLISELFYLFRTDLITEISVDSDLKQKIRVNVDFTLPGQPCNEFGLDAVDFVGEQMLEVSDSLVKKHTTKGLETRGDLKGCRMTGHIQINKVKGEFHVAFGRKALADDHGSSHIHQFTMLELMSFNASHIIHKLSFGDDFPGAVHPLDGTKKMVPKGLGRFQYYIQIVPTVYKHSNGRTIYSNQYSVTEMDSIVQLMGGSFKQPGIFFRYEMSPYTVTYHERYAPFSHLITEICAIIGGFVVVSGMLNSLVWYTERYFEKGHRFQDY